jgi:hypothetical protein
MAERGQAFGQQLDLRGLATALGALECDEQAFCHLRTAIYDLRADE